MQQILIKMSLSTQKRPSLQQVKQFLSLVIIEGDENNELRLPYSLKPANSDYFERILFILYNDEPASLINDFCQYSPDKQSLP